MKTYYVYDSDHESCVLYHAIAEDENQVRELAEAKGYDLDGLVIEEIKDDVRDPMGRKLAAMIMEF